MKYETDNCLWLNVPYHRRNEAKALGARWDSLTKRWYAPASVSVHPFRLRNFLPTSRKRDTPAKRDQATPAVRADGRRQATDSSANS